MESNGMFESMNAQSNATPPRNTGVSNTRGNDSTSDDTASSGSVESDLKSIDEACGPLVSQLALEKGKFKRFVVDSCAGLLGSETLRQYPCLMDFASGRFYVWLADTDFALFTKSTFMNLCNFAENQGADKLLLLIDAQHTQKKQYKSMFQVIDAHKLGSNQVKMLIEGQDRLAAKALLEKTAFYELEL